MRGYVLKEGKKKKKILPAAQRSSVEDVEDPADLG